MEQARSRTRACVARVNQQGQLLLQHHQLQPALNPLRGMAHCARFTAMGVGAEFLAVPVTFAGVDLLVQVSPVNVVGSQPTSAASRLTDAYERAEKSIKAVAAAVAGMIADLQVQSERPRQVEVEFGLAISIEGDIVLVKGTTEATLAIRLSYEVSTRDDAAS